MEWKASGLLERPKSIRGGLEKTFCIAYLGHTLFKHEHERGGTNDYLGAYAFYLHGTRAGGRKGPIGNTEAVQGSHGAG